MLDFRDDSNRAKYFVSSSVPHLFDILKDGLKNRIKDGYDFYANWNHFVAFSLFIIRCAHCQTDKKAYGLIKLAINDYLKGNSLGVDLDGMLIHDNESNYINYFSEGRSNHDLKTDAQIIEETSKLYKYLIKVWNDNYNTQPFRQVEYCFANCFKVDNDEKDPNFTNSFQLLFREYSLDGDPGTIKLFNCRRSPTDKPRFTGKKIDGYKID